MAMTEPLVSTAWLESRLGEPGLRVFDTTTFLRPHREPRPGGTPYRIESGRAQYAEAHVPGAGFLDLTTELSDRESEIPFMLPDAAQFGEVVARKGVSASSTVVLYSAGHVMWSTRVWWMFAAFGFDGARVLDGGFDLWRREGRPVTVEEPQYPPGDFVAKLDPRRVADRHEVLAAIGDAGVCTINALSPEVYTGTARYDYGRPGHIPGSRNVHYGSLLDEGAGTYLPLAALRERFRASRALDRRRVIAYCGGGISATVDALALERLGHPDVAVYDGSMTEWARDPSLPLETGSEGDG